MKASAICWWQGQSLGDGETDFSTIDPVEADVGMVEELYSIGRGERSEYTAMYTRLVSSLPLLGAGWNFGQSENCGKYPNRGAISLCKSLL